MLLKIIIKKKKKDGHATHHFVRTPHPEHGVPLTFTMSTRDWAVSRCQWICHHFCSSRTRWEGPKVRIQAVLIAIQPAAFLLGEEKEQLPGAANSAQPGKSCHLHMHQSSSQITREEGRERKGWKLTASWTYTTHRPHHSKAWSFSSESKSPESAKLRTLRQTLPMFGNAFLVTVPNEINRLVEGLANTPAPRTVRLAHIWARAVWTVGQSHVTPQTYNSQQRAEQGGGEHTITCYCQR